MYTFSHSGKNKSKARSAKDTSYFTGNFSGELLGQCHCIQRQTYIAHCFACIAQKSSNWFYSQHQLELQVGLEAEYYFFGRHTIDELRFEYEHTVYTCKLTTVGYDTEGPQLYDHIHLKIRLNWTLEPI